VNSRADFGWLSSRCWARFGLPRRENEQIRAGAPLPRGGPALPWMPRGSRTSHRRLRSTARTALNASSTRDADVPARCRRSRVSSRDESFRKVRPHASQSSRRKRSWHAILFKASRQVTRRCARTVLARAAPFAFESPHWASLPARFGGEGIQGLKTDSIALAPRLGSSLLRLY